MENTRVYPPIQGQGDYMIKTNMLWEMCKGEKTELSYENSNKLSTRNEIMRDLMAGEVCKEIAREHMFSKRVMDAHDRGAIHVHDLDYTAQAQFNCCLLNLEDMLQNGTVLNDVMIERPKSFATACTITTQILAKITSNQYGGVTINLAHLAPFVEVSRQKWRALMDNDYDATKALMKEVRDGLQTLQYQMVTITGTNGQAAFVTLILNHNEGGDDNELLIREVLNQRIKGVKNAAGMRVNPAFPKLVYVLDENSFGEFYELTRLAAECTAKRMVPDYLSAKKCRELKKGSLVYPMGCRSFLSAEDWLKNEDGSHRIWGRFNQGVVTLNLPYIAYFAKDTGQDFWTLLAKYCDIAHEALRTRHERLKMIKAGQSPTHFMYGGLARLDAEDSIEPLLYNGYSSISLGYAGLWECVEKMTGKTLIQEKGREFGMRVMQFLNSMCDHWRDQENIGYSVYGSPIESSTGTFAETIQKYGYKKDYITNSYHVNVAYDIDAFEKLSVEAPFQALSTAGAVSYVEAPNLVNNINAVLEVMKHIYNTILYAEINLKLDNCAKCGFEGEAALGDDLIFECPVCGNRDESTLSVVRRTCGYLGTQRWSHGRTAEIKDRVLHL